MTLSAKLQSYLVFRFLTHNSGYNLQAYSVTDQDPFHSMSRHKTLQVVLDHKHLSVWPAIGRPLHCLALIGRVSGANLELLDNSQTKRQERPEADAFFCSGSQQQSPVFCLAGLSGWTVSVLARVTRNSRNVRCLKYDPIPIIQLSRTETVETQETRPEGADQQLPVILRKVTSDTILGSQHFLNPPPSSE